MSFFSVTKIPHSEGDRNFSVLQKCCGSSVSCETGWKFWRGLSHQLLAPPCWFPICKGVFSKNILCTWISFFTPSNWAMILSSLWEFSFCHYKIPSQCLWFTSLAPILFLVKGYCLLCIKWNWRKLHFLLMLFSLGLAVGISIDKNRRRIRLTSST